MLVMSQQQCIEFGVECLDSILDNEPKAILVSPVCMGRPPLPPCCRCRILMSHPQLARLHVHSHIKTHFLARPCRTLSHQLCVTHALLQGGLLTWTKLSHYRRSPLPSVPLPLWPSLPSSLPSFPALVSPSLAPSHTCMQYRTYCKHASRMSGSASCACASSTSTGNLWTGVSKRRPSASSATR